jgi:hypothetical protein
MHRVPAAYGIQTRTGKILGVRSFYEVKFQRDGIKTAQVLEPMLKIEVPRYTVALTAIVLTKEFGTNSLKPSIIKSLRLYKQSPGLKDVRSWPHKHTHGL